jgi:hypothetical protein
LPAGGGGPIFSIQLPGPPAPSKRGRSDTLVSIQMTRFRLSVVAAFALATPLAAQQPSPQQASAPTSALRASPSGRATTAVTLARPRAEGQAAPAGEQPIRVSIDYGQPHARGRQVIGTVVPMNQVWRTGANDATTLTTDVDLMFGETRVPKGVYTLFTLPGERGWKLIVNKQSGQWGTEHNAAQDLARIDLKARSLPEPMESFTIWLVPAADAPARGVLKMAWGNQELSTDWRVAQ